MLSREEYQELRDRNMEQTLEMIREIGEIKDPLVKYRDIRPILDLKHMIETSAEKYGPRPAFWVKRDNSGAYSSISYKEMESDMNALGTSLILGGLKDKRIAIIGENSYEWAISYLAVMCGTGVAVPLDKELPAGELKQLLIAADCSCVIFSKKFESTFKEIKDSGDTKLEVLINMGREQSEGEILALRELISAGRHLVVSGNRDFLNAQIIPDEMGVILFTSGTTGVSKGVMLSHRNIVTDVMLSPTVLHVSVDDIFFSVLPVHHTYECTCGFLVPIYKGASIAICEGLRFIAKNLQEAKPTMFLGVPAIFESMYKKIWQNVRKKGKEDTLKKMIALNRKTKKIGLDIGFLFQKDIKAAFGGRMREVICGGAAINPEILQGIRDFGINALQGYGLTETAPIGALNPDIAPVNESAGRAIPGVKVKIEGADPETGIGEICIFGANVMLGYYNNPEATAEVLKDGWYYTGDLGKIDDKGYVYITGRKKNVIITKNGKNVYPEEIEYYLSSIPYIQESMVWGKESEDSGDTMIVASIYANADEVEDKLGKSWSDQELERLLWGEIDKINGELPFFKRVRKIKIRKEEFEKNTSKKIKRFVESNKE